MDVGGLSPRAFRRMVWVRTGIIAASFVIAGAALFFLDRDMGIRANEITERARAREAGRNGVEALAELTKDALEAERYQTTLNAVLPPQEDLFDFPRWADGLGTARRVRVTFAFEGAEVVASDAAPGYAGFTLIAEGALSDVLAYLGAVESGAGRFLVDFADVGITRTGSEMSASTRGRVYFR